MISAGQRPCLASEDEHSRGDDRRARGCVHVDAVRAASERGDAACEINEAKRPVPANRYPEPPRYYGVTPDNPSISVKKILFSAVSEGRHFKDQAQ
jgi:hypothetical protein